MSALKNNSNIPFSRKSEETEKSMTKLNERSALIDITNDSPIVGVALGNLETPLSNMTKQWINRAAMTPGSGEALLRGQVKTLLQKVEEEAVISKISFEGGSRFLHLQGFVNSPSALIAPTPANTPQISNLSDESINSNCLGSTMSSSLFTKKDLKISQVQETTDSEKSFIIRSLMLDFSEKSVSSKCFSDDSSDWSLKVNTSSIDEASNYEDEVNDGGWIDNLCNGITKMSVTAKFAGKHTRFVYDSDGEIVDEEEMKREDFADDSPETMRLQGLLTPEGKLLPLEYGSDDDDEEEYVESEIFTDVLKGNARSKDLPNAQGKHLRFPEEDG